MPEPTDEQLERMLDGALSADSQVTIGSQSKSKRSARDAMDLYDWAVSKQRARQGLPRTRVYRQLGGFRSN